MIYQELSLAPHLQRDGEHPARRRADAARPRRSRRACARWPRAALAQLGHDDIPPDAAVGTLSVAAQQLVEIARALAVGCRVLVLDEPTSSLGRADVERLFALLRRLKAQGHAIVYISHFIEEVKTIADRFVVLRDGRNAGGGATADATHDAIVALMVGAAPAISFRARRARAARRSSRSAASSRASRRSRSTAARSSASPALVGSGRTRLLRTLFGLEPVRSGRVRIGVVQRRGDAAHAALARRAWAC